MESQDVAILYDTYFNQLKNQIDKLKSINIDVALLEEDINKINTHIETELSKVDIRLNNFGIELIYQEGIKKLNKIANILNNYNFYFQLSNLLKLLRLKLRDISKISIEELDIYIDEIENYLTQIKFSSTINYQDEEKIIEQLYVLAYELIKQEIILKGNSRLLEYVKNSQIDQQFIDRLIHDEIEKIDLNSNIELATKIYELDSVGITSSYVDLELLKILTNHISKGLKEIIPFDKKESLMDIMTSYEDGKEKLDKVLREVNISELQNKIKVRKRSINKNKRTIWFSIVSFIVSLSIIIKLGLYGIPLLSKEKKYKTTTTTYSTTEEISEETSYIGEQSVEKSIIYEETSPYFDKKWRDEMKREIKTYDLSDIELEDPFDYLLLDLEKLNRKPKVTSETKVELTSEDFYDETLKKLTIITQDKDDYVEEINGEEAAALLLPYILINVLLQFFISLSDKNITLIMNIWYLKDAIHYLKDEMYKKVKIYVHENGEWKKVDYEEEGSYYLFQVAGNRAEIIVTK